MACKIDSVFAKRWALLFFFFFFMYLCLDEIVEKARSVRKLPEVITMPIDITTSTYSLWKRSPLSLVSSISGLCRSPLLLIVIDSRHRNTSVAVYISLFCLCLSTMPLSRLFRNCSQRWIARWHLRVSLFLFSIDAYWKIMRAFPLMSASIAMKREKEISIETRR